MDIVRAYNIDVVLNAKKILSTAATFGIDQGLDLFHGHKCDFNMILDENCRNVVLIAMLQGQHDFLLRLEDFDHDSMYLPVLFSHADKHGNNILHYAVITDSEKFLVDLFELDVSDSQDAFASLCFRGSPNIFQRTSKRGKTPYDLAVAMKKTRMADLLLRYSQQASLQNVILTICPDDYYCSSDKETTANDDCAEFERSLVQSGIDVPHIAFNIENMRLLQITAFRLSYHGHVNKLKRVLKCWKLDLNPEMAVDWQDWYRLSEAFVERHSLQFSLVHAAVLGPLDQYCMDPFCSPDLDAFLEESGARTFTELLRWVANSLCRGNGWMEEASYLDHIRSTRSNRRSSTTSEIEKGYFISPTFSSRSQDKKMYRFIDGIVARIKGVKVKERIEILSHLMDDHHLPPPPLSSVVSLGQLHILQWLATRSDLSAPLSSDTLLYLLSREVSYLRRASKTLSIAAVLCAYAVGLGEVPTMIWLIEQFPEIRETRIGSMTFLHIAVVQNQIPCTYWLLGFVPSLLTLVTKGGLNALHLAIENGEDQIAFSLMNIGKSKVPTMAINNSFYELWVEDGAGRSVYWHLSHSKKREFKEWVSDNLTIIRIDSLITIMTMARRVSLKSMLMFMVEAGFFDRLETLFAGCMFEFDLISALEALTVPRPKYSYKYNETESAVGWEHDDLEGCGTRYDSNPILNWGSNSIATAVSGVITRSIYLQRNDIFSLILDRIPDHWTEKRYKKLSSSLVNYAEYVENNSAAKLVKLCIKEKLNVINSSKQWTIGWQKLCDNMKKGFIDLDLPYILEVIAQQQTWFDSKPGNVNCYEYSNWSFLQLQVTLPAVYIGKTSTNALCYAMRSNNDDIVNWLLSLPTLRGKLSIRNHIYEALDAGSAKFLKLLLVHHWPPDDSFDPITLAVNYLSASDKPCPIDIYQFLFHHIKEEGKNINTYFYDQHIDSKKYSGMYSAILAKLFESNSESWKALEALRWLTSQGSIDLNFYSDANEGVLSSLLHESNNVYQKSDRDKFQELVSELLKVLDDHGMDFSKHAKMVCQGLTSPCGVVKLSTMIVTEMLVERYDIDMQGFNLRTLAKADCIEFRRLQAMKLVQRDRTSLIQSIMENTSFGNFQDLLLQGGNSLSRLRAKDLEGRGLLHHAAVNGRMDILELLVGQYHMDLRVRDFSGRNVRQLAEAAGQSTFALRVRQLLAFELLPEFCIRRWRSFLCRRKFRKELLQSRLAATLIQSNFRRYHVYKKFGSHLREKRGSWVRFKMKWSPVLKLLSTKLPKQLSWSEEKMKMDISQGDEDDDLQQESLYQSLTAEAVQDKAEEEEEKEEVPVGSDLSEVTPTRESPSLTEEGNVVKETTTPSFGIVEMSRAVVKWVNRADERYKRLFQQRIDQLARGFRSYALSKRLQGSDQPIFETKLDAGMRIVWTPLQREESGERRLLVWFVSPHDRVSRCVGHICRSFGRMAQSPLLTSTTSSDSSCDERVMFLAEDAVLLDPTRNTPLKIHVVYSAELGRLAESRSSEWTPRLRLTQREHEVNGQLGTVLLIGRSGTGKTVCVSDRMVRDRERATRAGANSKLLQLFVSRSQRLCSFVQSHQRQQQECDESLENCDFLSWAKFMSRMENAAQTASARSEMKVYAVFNHVSFVKFRDEIYPHIVLNGSSNRRISELDASVVWTQMRSFIQGSIEAATCSPFPRPLLLEEYLQLAEKRCKVGETERRKVYQVFTRYRDFLSEHGLWDDATRLLDLLGLLQWNVLDFNFTGREASSVHYDKVYVDEVQDNTQAEISLYFLAAGMNTRALFLAGDPAQAVVEGVDFRFEEVREVVHRLSGGRESIAKPVKLERNFRSHSGILNVAALVLDKMFDAFPESAVLLSKDVGLFQGPRPGLYEAFGGLQPLLSANRRLVVITPDECVSATEDLLGRRDVVLGIREAKGLEVSHMGVQKKETHCIIYYYCSILLHTYSQ